MVPQMLSILTNVHPRSESLATDTLWLNKQTMLVGYLGAQVFFGITARVTNVEGFKTDKHFVNALEGNIHRQCAPTKRISDHAQAEICNKLKDIWRAICISDSQSDPINRH
jgi:hypothetical protein